MIARLLVGWRGYLAAGVLGAVLGGVAVGTAQQVTIERLRADAARVGEREARDSMDAATKAAKGRSDATEAVGRLPDGGAADRLRDAWSRD